MAVTVLIIGSSLHGVPRSPPWKVQPEHLPVLREIVIDKPLATLTELRDAFVARTGISLYIGTLRKVLQEAGITLYNRAAEEQESGDRYESSADSDPGNLPVMVIRNVTGSRRQSRATPVALPMQNGSGWPTSLRVVVTVAHHLVTPDACWSTRAVM